ncbi:MAG: deoxyribose-phosphate aldolase [Chloroflexota bacterium]
MTALAPSARLEHRLTRPTASLTDLHAAAGLAIEHELAALLVSPWMVRPAARLLARTPVRVGTVIGFPHGGQVAAVKAFEASTALEHGATQLDVVLNAGALVSGDDDAVLNDMLAVVEMAHSALATCGVIVRAGPVSEELLRRACRLAARSGAAYVVTSDGQDAADATVELAQFLHGVVGGHLQLKAAGVLTELTQLVDLVSAGADHISTTFSPQLAAEFLAWQVQPATRASASPADVGAATR